MLYLLTLLLLITAVVAQSDSLTAKLDELTAEAEELVRDFQDAHYKYTSKVSDLEGLEDTYKVKTRGYRNDGPPLRRRKNIRIYRSPEGAPVEKWNKHEQRGLPRPGDKERSSRWLILCVIILEWFTLNITAVVQQTE